MPRSTIEEVHSAVVGTNAPQQFLKVVSEHPDLAVLHSQKGDAPGSWNAWTLREYADTTARAVAGLQQAGLGEGQRILLMMRNRPDFHWLDLAAQFLRATPVSIYNSSSPEEIQYLAAHAGAELAIVEDESFLTRLLKVRDELPNLRQIYGLTPAEARVAEAVLDCKRLADVALKLGVSLSTVRTLLQRAFDKTDTRRQADLVKLILAHKVPEQHSLQA